MRSLLLRYGFRGFRGDVFGAIRSMMVVVPVVAALGIVSGMGATAGLYGAVVVGLVMAIFGGARLAISAPTVPVMLVMAVIINHHAATLTEALTIVALAGLMLVIMGLARVGQFVAYTPHIVVSGFMSGLGTLLIMVQIPVALGYAETVSGGLEALVALPDAVLHFNRDTAIIALAALGAAIFWPQALARFVPSILVGVIIGTVLSMFWVTGTSTITTLPGGLPGGLPRIQFPISSPSFILGALQPAFLLAVLAAVDALLTALVADSMTNSEHDPNRELTALGTSFIASCAIGGAPGSASTGPTVTNILAGATTRFSGILSALLILAFILEFGWIIETVPLAALAGVLIKTGWEIIDWRLVRRIHHIPRALAVILIMTAALTLVTDLIVAVLFGLIASTMANARQVQKLELGNVVSTPLLDQSLLKSSPEIICDDPYAAEVGLLSFRGKFTVASSRKLAKSISVDIKEHGIVIFDFSETTYLDDSAAMLIQRLVDVADEHQVHVILAGISSDGARSLTTLGLLNNVPEDHQVEALDEAKAVAISIIAANRASAATS